MQRFVILSFTLAIAVAAPQGYNYNTPQYSVGSTVQYQQQYSNGGGFGSASNHQYHAQQAQQAAAIQQAFASFNPAPALPSASSVAAAYRVRPQPQRRVLPPIVSKHIYYHAAADEPDEEIYEDNSTEQQRKHYNVVFIKAPHQSVRKIATQTAQALNEERTAIYVLSKKNDVSEIRQAISEAPIQPAKPEVFFIKYRTPEEAQHAQQTIQGQYDALGGSTNISNEGFVPISSVVGALDGGNQLGSGSYNGNTGSATIVGPSGGDHFSAGTGNTGSFVSSYLPPNKV